jgi:hypothetical protein
LDDPLGHPFCSLIRGPAANLDPGILPPDTVSRVSAMSALRRRPGPGTMSDGTTSYGHRRIGRAFRQGLTAGLSQERTRHEGTVKHEPVVNDPATNDPVANLVESNE